MAKDDRVVVKCSVGTYEATQTEIDAGVRAGKKMEINANTESVIFNLLGVNTREKAIIMQANLHGEATRIIAHRTVDGKYREAGDKQRLKTLGDMQNDIRNALKKGREAKAKL